MGRNKRTKVNEVISMKYVDNILNYKSLLTELVKRDIKVKYRRSILGLVWTVLNPLLTMCVLTIVFSNFFRFEIDNFPVYLLCGNIIFAFFSEATNMAMTSILGNGPLLKKIYVPKYLFPLAKIISSFVNLLAALIALIIVMIATQTKVYVSILFAIFPVIYVFIFALGIGLVLSALVVFFRDFLHLYSVILTLWNYLTPIFYPISILPENIGALIRINPLTMFVQMFRDCVLYGNIPSLVDNFICATVSMMTLIIGLFCFVKNQDKFVLKI